MPNDSMTRQVQNVSVHDHLMCTIFVTDPNPTQASKPRNNNAGSKAAKGEGQTQQSVIIEGLDSGTVVGIAFAAFAIGILLTGALWFIHTHTGLCFTHLRTHAHAYTHTHAHPHMHTQSRTHTHTHRFMVHSFTHTSMLMHMHTHTCTHIQFCVSLIYTHTHTYTGS